MNTRFRAFVSRGVNALFILLFIYFLIFPDTAKAYSRSALSFCATSIIPSLFIYLVLSQRIVAISAVSKLCASNTWGSVFIVLLGFLCGFPAGARNSVYLYQKGIISRKKGEYLCCINGSASLSFILAFAGAQIMGSVASGLKLLIFQTVATAVTALVLYPFLLKGDDFHPAESAKKYVRSTDLTDAISDSSYLLVRICGFVCTFFILGSAFSQLFPQGSIWGVILRGMLEFSGGIYCASEYCEETREVLCSLFLGFGSVSAIMQTASVVKGVFSLKPFVLSRLMIASLMTVFALLT